MWTPVNIPGSPHYTIKEDSHFGVWQVQARKLCHDTGVLNQILPHIRYGSVVLDCGAFNGDHTMAYATRAGKVLAFEPQRVPFLNLCTNVFLGRHENVFPVNAGVGANPSKVNLAPPEAGNLGATAIGLSGYEIDIVTIDSFGLQDVSFIKMDIEGYEPFALRGAQETLRRCRPSLVLEVNEGQLNKHGFTAADIMNEFQELGLHSVRAISGNIGDVQYDILVVPS